MKATRLPKLMVLFLLTAISVGVKAQVLVVHESMVFDKTRPMSKVETQIDMNKYQLMRDQGEHKVYVQKGNKAKRNEEVETATVTCILDYAPSDISPLLYITVLSKNYDEVFHFDWENYDFENGDPSTVNTIVCSVPMGVYDFMTSGFKFTNGLAVVVKEEVSITKDTTLVFNFADAKNKYSVETYKLNGDLCEEYIIDYSQGEPNVIREANINAFNDYYMLNLKGVGSIETFTCGSNLIQPGQEPAYTMYINDLSDRYRLTLARTVDADDTWYVCKYETESLLGSTTLKNDPANFTCYEERFVSTPAGNPDDGGGVMMMGTIISLDNVQKGSSRGQSETKAIDGVVRMYVDAPKNNELNQGHIDIMPFAGFGDRREVITFSFPDMEYEFTQTVFYPQYGLPVVLSENGIEYVNAGHDVGGNHSFQVPEVGDIMEYPGNPSFSYTDKQKLLPYGSGCPINAFMAQNYFSEEIGDYSGYFQCCYIGRYGEVREVDLDIDLKTEVYCDGELVTNSYSTHEADMWNYFFGKKSEGVVEAIFANENVVVDELPGKNLTTVHYNWGANDGTAPTLQMLWFKNQDNNVIDRFDTGANGTLEFAGGDFNFHMLPDKYFFDCKEQTVQVGYSPYNKNEWAALEVEEVPENFYMPGFGYFYRGSLKDVEGQGEKGWFDLKIRLEDASGNWQEQVISPAFRIDDKVDTGIENNNQYTITNNNAVYDLMGRRMESQQKGISIVRRANGDVRKVVVK